MRLLTKWVSPMLKKLRRVGAIAALGAGLISGCAEDDAPLGTDLETAEQNPLASGEAFIAIQRGALVGSDGSSALLKGLGHASQALTKEPESFYLAIRKSALDKQWFLSSYLNSRTDAQTLYSFGSFSL